MPHEPKFMLNLRAKMSDSTRSEATGPIVFYDGECGLCHGAVRFTLKRDTAAVFRFAPLASPAFQRLIPATERAKMPDSMVVWASDSPALTRSDAVVEMFRRLGGVWSVLGSVLAAVPRPIRNAGYRFVAAVREQLFARPKQACPVMAPELRARFLFD